MKQTSIPRNLQFMADYLAARYSANFVYNNIKNTSQLIAVYSRVSCADKAGVAKTTCGTNIFCPTCHQPVNTDIVAHDDSVPLGYNTIVGTLTTLANIPYFLPVDIDPLKEELAEIGYKLSIPTAYALNTRRIIMEKALLRRMNQTMASVYTRGIATYYYEKIAKTSFAAGVLWNGNAFVSVLKEPADTLVAHNHFALKYRYRPDTSLIIDQAIEQLGENFTDSFERK